MRFTDSDGHRITGFFTDTPVGVIAGQLAGLELRHRQHARVEDRIRTAKATGLRNLPLHSFQANAAWLEIVMAATDLVAWTQLLGFADTPELARCEIQTFRYRVLHVAARLTRGARQRHLRIDATWRWATAISTAWQAIRNAFTTTPLTHDTKDPLALGKPAPGATGRPVTPTWRTRHHQPTQPDSKHPPSGPAKNQG